MLRQNPKKKPACFCLSWHQTFVFLLLVSQCVCVVRRMEGRSCPQQTTEETASEFWNSKWRQLTTKTSPYVLQKCVRTKLQKKKNRSWAECNDSAFFFLFLVALHMNPQGTTFSELNICTCFTSPVFSHSSSCLTTAPLLFSHPLRLDRPGEYEREERGERMVSRRFTTLWICHFEDEVYECI